jgi:hypothetical protein
MAITWCRCQFIKIEGVPLATELGIFGPLLHVAIIRRTTDTFLFISQPLFKFRCIIFIGVRIIKELPGSVVSGTLYLMGPSTTNGGNCAKFISFFRRFREVAKSDQYVCLSVLPRGTAGLPLDGFSLNLVFEYFSKYLSREFKFH